MPRGFILQPTYRIENGRPIVRILGRLESGGSFLIRDDRCIPCFWIRAEDETRARNLGAAVRAQSPPRATMQGEPVARVEVPTPPEAPAVRDKLIEAGVTCYEADVRFAYRYLIDRGIRGSVLIDGKSRRGEGVDAVFDNPEVGPADWVPDLSVLSLDIETDPSAREVLSIALAGCGADDVLLLTRDGMSAPGGAVPCPTEADLLRAFVKRVRELDPDVITGWNVIDFDLAVLARIAERTGVPIRLGRGPEPLVLKPPPFPRASRQATVAGRVVLDGIDLLRGAFVKLDSYSLESVSQKYLGEGKTMTGSGRAEEILEKFNNDRAAFVEYNRKDAWLALRVLEKLRLVELTVQRSMLTGMPPDRVSASIASFDFLYLSELTRRGVVAPTVRSTGDDGEGTSGGHVLDPEPGLHRNVLVFDFKSLYPSIIRTFQIDPMGYLPDPADSDDPIVAPNGAAFRREPGILPRLLDDLFPRREAAKSAGDGVASQAIKILMNSFYGVLGTSACRFASPALANAITGFGREILLWSRDRIEKKGYKVLYGDTDSLFVASGADDPEKARTLAASLVDTLNRELTRHIKERWRIESRLELEFERIYTRLMLPVVRHGTVGARKRYAGLVEENGEPRVVFTGMEVVRRDWTELAKKVQREIYMRLFTDRPVEDYLERIVAEVRAGKHDDLLVYRKSLRKDLKDYTAATPPHVAAARKLSRPPGFTIRYVITSDGPEPADERTSPYDHEHYVQKQIRPVAEPVLTLLELDFDRIIGDERQMDLF